MPPFTRTAEAHTRHPSLRTTAMRLLPILLIALSFSATAHAQGIARTATGPLRAAYSQIQVVVDGDLARTTLVEVFVNDLPQPVEASFSFPLPADATVTGFAEWRDGRKLEAKATGKEAARAEYDRAVDAGERAVHGETDNAARFRMTLSSIPAGGSRRVELRYLQTLTALGGERTFTFPAGGDAPAATLTDVQIQLAGDRPIEAVETPNHLDARIEKTAPHQRMVRLSRTREGLGHDLVVRYRQTSEPLDLAARAIAPADGALGYLETRFAFNRDPGAADREPRAVVIALDTSLSMAGPALARAQEAALAVLDHLDARDTVEVISFATDVTPTFGALEPADDATLGTARATIEALEPGGRSNLEAALAQAADHLKGRPDGVLVLLTDGQPTAGTHPFGLDVDAAAFAAGRVVIGHFNYPSQTAALRALFPNVSVIFVPDGPAGAEDARQIGRLAAAPVIEDLHLEIAGTGVYQVQGTLPDRLAEGDSIRLLARIEGDAWIKVSGTLHGTPIDLIREVHPQTGDDLGLPIEWARLRVADLDTEWRHLDDEPARELIAEEIRALGTQYSLATRFTGYVMSDALDPDTIKPGDPEIRINAPRSALGVFALLPWGEVIHCAWDEEEGLWLGRFLVPRGTPDGLYRTRIFVENQADTLYRGTLFFRVDSTLPAFELTQEGGPRPLAPGEPIALLARPADRPTPKAGQDRIDPDPLDVKQVQVAVAGQLWTLEREPGTDLWSGDLPLDLPPGQHRIKLVAMDYARNTVEAWLSIEVE